MLAAFVSASPAQQDKNVGIGDFSFSSPSFTGDKSKTEDPQSPSLLTIPVLQLLPIVERPEKNLAVKIYMTNHGSLPSFPPPCALPQIRLGLQENGSTKTETRMQELAREHRAYMKLLAITNPP